VEEEAAEVTVAVAAAPPMVDHQVVVGMKYIFSIY
jgi:hypothetical protein